MDQLLGVGSMLPMHLELSQDTQMKYLPFHCNVSSYSEAKSAIVFQVLIGDLGMLIVSLMVSKRPKAGVKNALCPPLDMLRFIYCGDKATWRYKCRVIT